MRTSVAARRPSFWLGFRFVAATLASVLGILAIVANLALAWTSRYGDPAGLFGWATVLMLSTLSGLVMGAAQRWALGGLLTRNAAWRWTAGTAIAFASAWVVGAWGTQMRPAAPPVAVAAIGGLFLGSLVGLVQALALQPMGSPLRYWLASAVGWCAGATIGVGAIELDGLFTGAAGVVMCGFIIGLPQAVALARSVAPSSGDRPRSTPGRTHRLPRAAGDPHRRPA